MKLTKRRIIPLCIAAGCLLLCGVTAGISSAEASGQISQQAAERWQGEGENACCQVSIFANRDAGFDKTSVDSLKEQIDTALTNASLEASEGGQLWYCSYSTPVGTMPVNGATRTTAQPMVTAVGGSFFSMHPFTLESGTYLTENDLMQDRVVIDSTLAWQIFGSSNVSGMEILVNDQRLLIAGVVRPERDAASRRAYGDAPRMYISYALYEKWQGEDYGGTAPWIGCYEAVLPNPVRGFAENLIQEPMQMQDGVQVISNTGRYSVSGRWKTLRHLKEMVISEDGIAYPYWENAARIVQFDTAVHLGICIALLIWPVPYVLRLIWKLYRAAERFIAEKKKARKRRYRTIPEETMQE